MKNTMNAKTVNREQRDHELLQAYQATLELLVATNSESAKREALRFALRNGHPHYCVSYSHAYRLVCALMSGSTARFRVKGKLRQAMWHEIAGRVRQLTERNSMSRAKALDFVLQNCLASRFFITDAYAHNHLSKILHERQRRAATLAARLRHDRPCADPQ